MPLFKQKEIETLSITELLQELDPEKISRNLRWKSDTDYQSAVGVRVFSWLQQSENNFQSLNTRDTLARVYQKLIIALIEGGKYKEARQCCDIIPKVISTSRDKSEQLQVEAYCQFGLALVARELDKNYEVADQNFSKGLRICKRLESVDLEASCAISANFEKNKGIGFLPRKQYQNAKEHFARAIDMADKAGLREFRIPLLNYLALAEAREGEQRKAAGDQNAASMLSSALVHFKEANASYLQSFGQSELEQGCLDFASHLRHFGMAFEICSGYRQAIEFFEGSYEIRKNIIGQQRDRFAEVCESLGKAHEKLDEPEKAIAYYKEAKDVYETLPQPNQNAAKELAQKIEILEVSLHSQLTFTH